METHFCTRCKQIKSGAAFTGAICQCKEEPPNNELVEAVKETNRLLGQILVSIYYITGLK